MENITYQNITIDLLEAYFVYILTNPKNTSLVSFAAGYNSAINYINKLIQNENSPQ
jgi:hypothetical protein